MVISPASRAPQGARGLKCFLRLGRQRMGQSHPARGAWIEMTCNLIHHISRLASHPARGAWIEIGAKDQQCYQGHVAPNKEMNGQWSINHINSTGITYCEIEWPPEHFSSNKAGIYPRTWTFQSFELELLSGLSLTFAMTDQKTLPLTAKMPDLIPP